MTMRILVTAGPTREFFDTVRYISGRAVLTEIFEGGDSGDVQHIALTQSADVMLVAPATANMIAKMAAGLADDLVSTLIISADSPVIMVPAMNSRMWSNPIVQRNIKQLMEFGYRMIDPGEGWLACRTVGPGRMAEPAEIVETLAALLKQNKPKECK